MNAISSISSIIHIADKVHPGGGVSGLKIAGIYLHG